MSFRLSLLVRKIPFLQEFYKWAMLGSNQRPPPCKGGRKGSQGFADVHKPAYTSRFRACRTHVNFPVSTCTGVHMVYWQRATRIASGIRIEEVRIAPVEDPSGTLLATVGPGLSGLGARALFFEVREGAQSSLACSSVFSSQ